MDTLNATAEHSLHVAAKRFSFRTQVLLAFFVLIVSFFYGISIGLSRRAPKAYAALQIPLDPPRLEHIVPPPGLRLIPAGNDIAINGSAAEMANFVSDRNVKDIVSEQVAIWQARGYVAFGATSQKRGVAFARDAKTGDRFSIVAFFMPPMLREKMSLGQAVQGSLTAMSGRGYNKDAKGVIPDVPLPPGGSSGPVFSARDPGGRSFTAIYNNPGDIDTNIDFYRSTLRESGWEEIAAHEGEEYSQPIGSLTFRRGKEEVSFLLSSQAQARAQAPRRTLAFVSQGPAIESFDAAAGRGANELKTLPR